MIAMASFALPALQYVFIFLDLNLNFIQVLCLVHETSSKELHLCLNHCVDESSFLLKRSVRAEDFPLNLFDDLVTVAKLACSNQLL